MTAVTRPAAPCPFYGIPCEYVPMAEAAELAYQRGLIEGAQAMPEPVSGSYKLSAQPLSDPQQLPADALRDQFAGQALLGIMSNPELLNGLVDDERCANVAAKDVIAISAYLFADAMMRAREKVE